MKRSGISPVIGVLIIIGLVVAAGALAVTVVFDTSSTGTNGLGSAALDVDYESDLLIDVQLVKPVDGTVIVRTALGTEYELSQAGDSVEIPNQDGNLTPVAFVEKDEERSVLREIPPQSFTPDVIVKEGDDAATKLSSLGGSDIAVVQRDEYTGNVDISDGTVVGEDGSILRADTTEACAVNVENPAQLVNLEVDADSQTQHSICANHTTSEDTLLDEVRTSGSTGDELAGPLRVGSADGGNDGSSTLLTWGSEADWDAAVSESGVVHQSTLNTGHDDASSLKMGYDYQNFDEISPDPIAAWPLHEGGSRAPDLSGNNNNGSVSGTTQGTGIRGVPARDFDGSNDKIGLPTFDQFSSYTASSWVFFDDNNDGLFHHTIDITEDNTIIAGRGDGNGNIEYFHKNSGGFIQIGNEPVPDETWLHVTQTWDGSTVTAYLNGSSVGSKSVSEIVGDGTGDDIGYAQFNNEYIDGRVTDARVYNSSLSSSEVQTLYDVAAVQSSLTTATKSFDSSTRPDLANLDYSRNGGSVEITVIGSPGAAGEETKTVTLDGSSSADLTWNDAHKSFRVKITLSHSDVTKTPTVQKIGLQPP